MGIDINGSMMVGCNANELSFDDQEGEYELYEYIEDLGLDTLSPYFDSSSEDYFCGFRVDDVEMKDIDEWIIKLKEKSEEFEKLTGDKATLVGMQNVW